MPKITADQRTARRTQIVSAALELIVNSGVHRIAMSDIIAASGLSAGAIYTHFESKDEILASVVEAALVGSVNGIERAMAQDPLPDPADILAHMVPSLGDSDGAVAVVQVWGQVVVESQLEPLVTEHVAALHRAVGAYAAAWLAERGINDPELAGHLQHLILAWSQAYTVHTAFRTQFDTAAFLSAARVAVAALVGSASGVTNSTSSTPAEPEHDRA